jgi:hypothetical protein
MRIKFICCDVFARLAYAAAAVSENVIDLELYPMLSHNEPAELRAGLQSRIDGTDAEKYGMIILGYGICGNATVGLNAKLPMVIPRIHDCCTMFLGSAKRFLDEFGENLSTRWCTCGYYERGYGSGYYDEYETYLTNPEYLKLLNEYGEDNAEYIWQTLHPPIETKEAVYIEINGYEYGGPKQKYAELIAASGKGLRTVDGDPSWFFKLVNGPWDEGLFLTVNPGERVSAVYDMKEVVRAAK